MFNYNGNSPLATARTMTKQLAIVKASLTLFELCLELDLYFSEKFMIKRSCKGPLSVRDLD